LVVPRASVAVPYVAQKYDPLYILTRLCGLVTPFLGELEHFCHWLILVFHIDMGTKKGKRKKERKREVFEK
jgi:hypothetical protein